MSEHHLAAGESYQTGRAQVRIESPGCHPLVLQFFDEMRHVVIKLRRE